ncbi:cytochrome c oxidase copper chaperone 2-like isoform X1 [Nymphaea colorata]|nr:cytochrome c oxidase copper chaperone 2-like isoform X1 [Nymphaea colorata]
MGALDVSSVRAKTMGEKETPSLAQQQKHHEEEEASKAAAPKKKICCACPDTKRLRDECIVQHGEAACSKWIRAHLECLRAEGFKLGSG